MELFTNLFIALFIYILGIASPGPSNLAIAQTSIYQGRKAGIFFALGITVGSFFWGILAAIGLQSLLEQYSYLLYILKILGGIYFLYLAYNSLLRINKKNDDENIKSYKNNSYTKYFISGILMHLLNPKAIAVWVSIIAIALPSNTANVSVLLPVIICLPFGILVFITYAFMFSTKRVVDKYFYLKKYIDSIVGVIFTGIGLKLIFGSEK